MNVTHELEEFAMQTRTKNEKKKLGRRFLHRGKTDKKREMELSVSLFA
jgi:hypothetical protein